MIVDSPPSDQPKSNGLAFQLLERLTAAVLLLVVAALVWVLVAANGMEPAQGERAEVQAIIVLVLLSAALVLVSVVALLHTR